MWIVYNDIVIVVLMMLKQTLSSILHTLQNMHHSLRTHAVIVM